MKLKINKACDLSSISVLPPPVRRSNSVSNGPQASQLRSQSAQLRSQSSQQSLSQGFSSQHGMFSQLSQSSLDEALINDQRVGSQERENPVKRISSLPPISYTREESQMPMSRSSANLMHKWNSVSLPDHRCQHSEELEHRVGMMETSLNKIGMVLESVQSDVMQINKGTKEVSMETEGIRQKLVVQDSSLQLMNKGQDDIKAIFDGGFKSISEQLRKDTYQDKLQEILLVLSALPEKLETAVLKSQNELCNSFTKEVQALTCRLTEPNPKDQALSNLPPKATSCISAPQGKSQPTRKSAVTPKICVQTTLASKIETGGWKSVKLAKATITNMTSNKMHLQKGVSSIQQDRECRVFIESDEEDEGFSCLLQEKETGNYWMEEVKEEAEKILRKARRRKRKCGGDVILIN